MTVLPTTKNQNPKKYEYVKNNPKDKERPNVLKNFAHSQRGLKILRKKMKQHGPTHLSSRIFNQDPVEIFFGQNIRQHGIRNTKPTTIDFIDYYKSIFQIILLKITLRVRIAKAILLRVSEAP